MGYREGTGANRRKMDRLRTRLQVSAKVRSGLFSRGRAQPGVAVDYNRYGMALICPVNLRPKTRLLLDIGSDHMMLRRVRAQVVSSMKVGRDYRLGVRFYRKLTDFAEPGPGHPLHFLLGLEQSIAEPAQS